MVCSNFFFPKYINIADENAEKRTPLFKKVISISKIMTAIVAIENSDINNFLTILALFVSP